MGWELYDELIALVPGDLVVDDCFVGLHWTVVRSAARLGVAMTPRGRGMPERAAEPWIGRPLADLAQLLRSWNEIDAAVGLAAVNAALNTPAAVTASGGMLPTTYGEQNVFSGLTPALVGRKVAVVGHFPGLEELAAWSDLTVLERDPWPGDLPDPAAEYLLPEQEVVFITASTLVNKTLPRLLTLAAGARVILVGPSTPLAPALFRFGVDVLGGMIVREAAGVADALRRGADMQAFRQGAVMVRLTKEGTPPIGWWGAGDGGREAAPPSMVERVDAGQAVGRRVAMDVSRVSVDAVQPMLRRGDVVQEEHVTPLLDAGHGSLFVERELEKAANEVWEDEASLTLAEALAGEGVVTRAGGAGKSYLVADRDGVLVLERASCRAVNGSDVALLITRQENLAVQRGDLVAVLDLIPLSVAEDVLTRLAARLASMPRAVSVVRPREMATGLVVTGTELYLGRIEDAATAVVEAKVRRYGGIVGRRTVVPDDEAAIAEALASMLSDHEVVIVTGGMSVDPTDRTPAAVRQVADEVIKYGLPVLPNAMSLVATKGSRVILAVSSGIVHYRDDNVLDLLLPQVYCGRTPTRRDLVEAGVGGLGEAFAARWRAL